MAARQRCGKRKAKIGYGSSLRECNAAMMEAGLAASIALQQA